MDSLSDNEWKELLPTLEGGWDSPEGLRFEAGEILDFTPSFRSSDEVVWSLARRVVAEKGFDPQTLWCYGRNEPPVEQGYEVHLIAPDTDQIIEVEFDGSPENPKWLEVTVDAPEDAADRDLLRMVRFLANREEMHRPDFVDAISEVPDEVWEQLDAEESSAPWAYVSQPPYEATIDVRGGPNRKVNLASRSHAAATAELHAEIQALKEAGAKIDGWSFGGGTTFAVQQQSWDGPDIWELEFVVIESFDDVLRMDDRSVGRIAGELGPERLAVLLSGADQAVQDKFLQHFSRRIRAEIEAGITAVEDGEDSVLLRQAVVERIRALQVGQDLGMCWRHPSVDGQSETS